MNKQTVLFSVAARICKNCGHDINDHKTGENSKPGVCWVTHMGKDGEEHDCPCNQFVPGDEK